MKKGLWPIVLSSFLAATCLGWGADVTPSFSTIPTGWTVDRYAPASFSNVGTYQGMNNVLGIGINIADGHPPGSPGFPSFSNTQGEQTPVSGGAGSVLQAELYIPSSWRDVTQGNVRTDMWGVMTDASLAVSDYPIIGFTNYGGAPRLRAYDVNTGGWIDLTTSITYDAWTTLSIDFTGTSFVYGINGVTASTVADSNLSTAFKAVIMQAYNFADPSITGPAPVLADYTAHWANTPEPGFYGALGIGMAGLLVAARRRRKASA